MTVFGLTIIKEDRQSLQTSNSHAHKGRSADVSLGRFTERRSTPSWCAEREVLQLECGSRFEGRRRGGDQHVKRAQRQTEKLTEDRHSTFSFSSMFTIPTDHRDMREMFFTEAPPFDSVMADLKELEDFPFADLRAAGPITLLLRPLRPNTFSRRIRPIS
jgi:hypothetical protein